MPMEEETDRFRLERFPRKTRPKIPRIREITEKYSMNLAAETTSTSLGK